ncbi:MAG: 30S ribosomal protein S3 [bacterium]|nr:30S ribosomal protein S3 [bacterium]
MGQKAHPRSLRLGIVKDWDCNWFATKDYADLVVEDFTIRQYLKGELKKAGLASIYISRKAELIEVNVKVSRPGVVFGKGNKDTGYLVQDLKKKLDKDVTIKVTDIKHPDLNAKLLTEWIVFQLERRSPFRRSMKTAVQKAIRAGVKGVRVACSGRLAGAEIARTEWYKEGKVPLQTFRADIDYAFSEALTTYGKIGVKLFLYHGDIINKKEGSVLVNK